MGTARETTSWATTTSPPSPALATEPAGRSFSDGLAANSPRDVYARENPEAAPAQLSKGSGDVKLQGKHSTKTSLGEKDVTRTAGVTGNTKAKNATVSYTQKKEETGDFVSGSVSGDLRDDNSVASVGAKGTVKRDGTSTRVDASLGFDEEGNLESGAVGGEIKTATHGGSANVDVHQGHVTGVGVGAKTTVDGFTTGGSFAVGRSASEPREVDGQWAVDWDFDASASASGGGRTHAMTVAGSVGGSGNQGGTQLFATREEATSFRNSFLTAQDDVLSQAQDVGELADGESVGSSSKVDASLSVALKAGQFSGSAGVSGESGSGWVVKRQGPYHLLTVTRDSAIESTFSGSVMGLIKLGWGDANRNASSFAVRFEADDRDHQASLQRWMKKQVIDGGELLWIERGAEHDDSSSVAILGVRFEFKGTTGRKVTKYADGSTVETVIGQSNEGVSVPLVGKHDESHALTMTDEGEGASYALQSRVESDSANAAQKAMAQASGGNQWGAHGTDEASGQWTVTSEFSEEQVEQFIAWAVGGQARARLSMVGGAWVISRLEAAGNDEDARQAALAAYVAHTGADGLAVIHEVTSGDVESFPELEGDDTFLGQAGWTALRAKAAAWEEALAGGAAPGPIAAEAVTLVVQADDRLQVLRDRQNYQDLPPNLRSQELDRNYELMFRFDRIAKGAREKLAASAQAVAPTTKVQAGGPDFVGPTPSPPPTHEADNELGMLQAELDGNWDCIIEDKASAELWKRRYDHSVKKHTHHSGGRGTSPKDAFGTKSSLASWFDGEYVDDYMVAESNGDLAGKLFRRANQAFATVQSARVTYEEALADPTTAMGAIDALNQAMREAERLYTNAATMYQKADDRYRDIARKTGTQYYSGSYPAYIHS